MSTPAASLKPGSSRRGSAYRLLWRWHFYAGLFCLPFIVWLSITGIIYLFRPQIEPLLERQYAHVTHGPAQPPAAQVAAALRAVPGTVLNAYELPTSPDAATRVLLGKGAQVIRVFVDPSTLRVLHVVNDDSRFMRVIFYLHGELLLGTAGSMLVELAASWTILMLLTGLYLWWPRSGRLGGVLYPRLRQGRRTFWRDLHAVTGVWVSCLALFLLVSGLPWAKSWGGLLHEGRQLYAQRAISQDWATGSAFEHAQNRKANAPVPANDDMAGMHMGDAPPSKSRTIDYTPLNRLVPTVAAAHIAGPVLIAPPSRLDLSWNVRSDASNRSLRETMTLNPATGRIVSRQNFAQRPLIDRLIGYGVAIHVGALFPPLNQILGVVTGLGLITLAVSAVVLWWRRRPAGTLGAPPAHDARYPLVMVGLLIALGIALPLLGASMLAVLLVERLWLRRRPGARRFLGLRSPP